MGGYARAHRCLGGSCCQFGSKSTEPRRSVSIAIHHAKGELCFAANVLWQEPGRQTVVRQCACDMRKRDACLGYTPGLA